MNEKSLKIQVLNEITIVKQNIVDYYRSRLHNREYKDHRGVTVGEELSIATDNLNSWQRDYRDYIYYIKSNNKVDVFSLCDQFELQEALKSTIRKAMRDAYQYSNNVLLVVSLYRQAIQCKEWLDQLTDVYSFASCRYFIRNN